MQHIVNLDGLSYLGIQGYRNSFKPLPEIRFYIKCHTVFTTLFLT